MTTVAHLAHEVRRRLRPLRDLPRYRIARCHPAWRAGAGASVPRPVSTVLLTCGFGPERYAIAAKRLADQARRSGFFSKVIAFTSLEDVPGLSPERREQCEALARQYPRGFGLWAWKPTVLDAMLKHLPPDCEVFYVDAGCEISAWGGGRFSHWLGQLREHRSLFFSIPFEEREWSHPEVLARFGRPVDDRSDQIQATWFAVVNDAAARATISAWASACLGNGAQLLRPRPFQPSMLIEAREDQSILSCLLKQQGGANVMRWEDHFTPELYHPDSWILLMPVHTLRNASGESVIDALLERSTRESCLHAADRQASSGLADSLRAAMRRIRESAYCIREAWRGARRVLQAADKSNP